MELLKTPEELKTYCANVNRPLGIVPTMGSIHEGHLELVRQAKVECTTVLATLFVNPAQFEQRGDFASYPRDLINDSNILSAASIHALYAPEASMVYPNGFSTSISVNGLSSTMEGLVRPGHFEGVATIVAKLLIGSGADYAYFGRKDAQQLAVIKRMVADLEVPSHIREVETIREPDGLALSSRNRLMNSDQRAVAPVLYRALATAGKAFYNGERRSSTIIGIAHEMLKKPQREGILTSIDYIEMVNPDSMQPWKSGNVMLAGAIRLGNIRIIDNIILVDNYIDEIHSEE